MRNRWTRIARIAVVASAAVASSVAFGQKASDVLVDVNLKDADMMTAVRTLTQRTGVQFVVEPSNEPYGRITLKLDGATADDAVHYICEAAGAYFHRDDNGVIIISHSKPVPVVKEAPIAAPTRLYRIRMMKADPREVYDQLIGTIPFDSDYGFPTLDKLKVPEADRTRIFGGTTIQPQFGPVTAPTTTPLTNTESGSQIKLPGEGGNQVGGGGFGVGGGGNQGGGFGGGGNQGGGIGGGGIGGGQGVGGGNLRGGQGLVPSGIDFITYDPTDNSLIVRGTEEAFNTLQSYIQQFDIAPKQVLIKVEFITTLDNFTHDIGFDFLYQRATVFAGTSPGTFANSGDPVFINYASGNVTTRLRTQLLQSGGKVVSAPIVRTLNNQPATVQSTLQQYIGYTTQTVTGNGTIVNTPNVQQVQASTQLNVNPRINFGDNTVTLYLTPQIQNFVGFSTTAFGQLPNTSTQAIRVVARVKSGETMVLGGLTQKNDSFNENRVPVLSDLPILGQFFRSNYKSIAHSELLIFVTPTIIEDDDAGNPGGP